LYSHHPNKTAAIGLPASKAPQAARPGRLSIIEQGADISIPSIRMARSNRILASLPREVLDRIIPSLRLKPLNLRLVLQGRDIPVENVVFPLFGVASMISMGDTGGSVEVATIGCEGMVGLPLLLGGRSGAGEVFIQVPGEGIFMEAKSFQRHVGSEPAFLRVLLLYTQALITQVAQCSACNNGHSIIQRSARWLLQTQDRVRGTKFPLTHEFLGLMLGVRRASVTLTAQTLQKRGLIEYRRGIMTIVDRSGLEKASCECYRLIHHESGRLMRLAARRPAVAA
jgi:CRP-like cAMP-binding protein